MGPQNIIMVFWKALKDTLFSVVIITSSYLSCPVFSPHYRYTITNNKGFNLVQSQEKRLICTRFPKPITNVILKRNWVKFTLCGNSCEYPQSLGRSGFLSLTFALSVKHGFSARVVKTLLLYYTTLIPYYLFREYCWVASGIESVARRATTSSGFGFRSLQLYLKDCKSHDHMGLLN